MLEIRDSTSQLQIDGGLEPLIDMHHALRRGDCGLVETLRTLADPAVLVRLLEAFLLRLETGRIGCLGSYRHDNGFTKVPLLHDHCLRTKLRLHLWDPEEVFTWAPQNIHNHRWNFASAILFGSLIQRRYEWARLGTPYHHYRYLARSNKDYYVLQHIGLARAKLRGAERFERGQVYGVSNDVLHQMEVPDSSFAATLVLTQETAGWVSNDMLSDRLLGGRSFNVSSPPLDVGSLRIAIIKVLERIRV